MAIGVYVGTLIGNDGVAGGISSSIVYVFDDFNRINNQTSMGNAVTGQPWEIAVDIWGILNNQAYLSTSIGTSIATIDSLQSTNIAVQCTFSINSHEQRLLFRATTTSNYWYVRRFSTNYELHKLVAGVDTLVDTFSTSPLGGDVIRVELVGNVIAVKVNGVAALDTTDAFNQSATDHGIGSVANNTPQWDNFSVSSL